MPTQPVDATVTQVYSRESETLKSFAGVGLSAALSCPGLIEHKQKGRFSSGGIVGHLPKRDLRARGSADQYVGKVLKVAPVLRRVTHVYRDQRHSALPSLSRFLFSLNHFGQSSSPWLVRNDCASSETPRVQWHPATREVQTVDKTVF